MAKSKAEPQREALPSWQTFLFELVIYVTLLFAYFFLVLHYLSGWFKDLFDHNRQLFAVMALVIMIGQTLCLEVISALLLHFTRRGKG